MDAAETKIRSRLKIYIAIIIAGLGLSGITAFPLETELAYLINDGSSALQQWLNKVYSAIKTTNESYPFLSYGTDWLAFAHLMLAILFTGPFKNPIKNKWVIEFGIICCLMIIPLALIAGHIRGIPFFWQLIDCSFGLIAIVPLYLCLSNIQKLEKLNQHEIYL
jgi:hypothetical protein